jgi:hypothetical protein
MSAVTIGHLLGALFAAIAIVGLAGETPPRRKHGAAP